MPAMHGRLPTAAMIFLVLTATSLAQTPDETHAASLRIAEGRAIAREFGAELKSALERAISELGPAAATQVCREEAPRIAARLSERRGVSVARTALRVRNAGNAAQSSQREILERFAGEIAAGADPETVEHFETRADGSARFLKAIVTAPVCTTCHGDSIPPEVRRELRRQYPEDQATGFRVGELRGAFSVEWPAGRALHPDN
jgi:hypothetical protein